ASTMMLVVFALGNIAVVVMREGKVQGYMPVFRSPLYPWVQIAAVCVYVFFIVEMGLLPIIITGAFCLLGIGWFAAYCKVCVRRQSALVHLVQRVTSKDLVDGSLETELRKIVHERDEIIEDRFDALVKNCEIIDLEHSVTGRELFSMVAKVLASRLEIPEERLQKLLHEREKESSTVVGPGIAIPHIIIDGVNLFDMVVIRCREGIEFHDKQPHVHTAFVLVGTRDERNYHLRALMAIAQIAQETGFELRWLAARDTVDMRNILLLSGRRRSERTAQSKDI
ncbi:MAG: PTS sugar transporter subunit IIA, partial [Candidatus Coatesbacteria bacterium]|nr:PTS sugar transporter subunit IIA [Candidatus Coatesbacteria bacterium]